MMAEKFNAITDETYVFIEGEEPNQFFFYRKDGEVLGDIDHEPMDFYHAWVMQKMMSGEIEGMVANNILSELSDDGKCMRITVKEIAKGPIIQIDLDEAVALSEPVKKESWFKRLKNKLFG
jgi:hypothetical protein